MTGPGDGKITGKRNRLRVRDRLLKMRKLGELAPKYAFSVDLGESSKDDYFLSLPFKRSWVAILVVGAFLLAFSIPLVTVSGQFLGNSDESLFSLVAIVFSLLWSLGWSVGVAILALVFLAVAFGRETLRVRGNKLILRLGIYGIGFGGTYDASLIRNFRQSAPNEKDGSGWRGDHLAFDFAGETIQFGSALEGERALQILGSLASRFPNQHEPLPALPKSEPAEQIKPAEILEAPAEQGRVDHSAGEPIKLGSVSSVALIAANLIPVFGVLFDDWSIGEIMLLFWAESAVIGFYNLLKLIKIGQWMSLFYGPFFVGHYGGFMAGHLLFIYGFFGSSLNEGMDATITDVFTDFRQLLPALVAYFISHGVSYVKNFVGRKEYLGRDVRKQMSEPYKRIIIMHLTIIFGGFLTMALSSAWPALLLLIGLKVTADLGSHLKQHA